MYLEQFLTKKRVTSETDAPEELSFYYSPSLLSGILLSGMITVKRYGFSAKKWSLLSGIRIFKFTKEVFELKIVSELQI